MINIPEVEHSAGHTSHLPGGDELVRHRGETVGGHRHDVVIETFNMVVILSLSEPVITCCPCLVSSQVEVDVVGEVDGSGGRHHGSELDLQSSLGVQTVQDVVENVSRISLVSIRTEVREGDGAGLLTDSSAPVDLVQSHQTSVESVGSIVLGVRLYSLTGAGAYFTLAREYSAPSRQNLPSAILLATRPTTAPM